MALDLFGFSLPKVSLPSLPKISLPKVSLPKVSLPSLPKVEVPKVDLTKAAAALPVAVGVAAAGAVQRGELPRVSLPELPKVSLPSLPAVSLPSLPKVEVPKVDLPDLNNRTGGGNFVDTIIEARDRSYSSGIEHIAGGNVAGGGAQFGATAAADVLLPLDLLDVGNKWMTGRGNQIDGETALWAAIDAVSLAAAPFTFGASYAAARAAKAGKVAAKTAKIGGEMGKISAVTKLVGALQGAGKSTGAVRTAVKVPTSSVKSAANLSTAIRKQAEAAQTQYSKMLSALKAPKSAAVGTSKSLGAAGSLNKAGTALKYTGLGLGTGAIGLTALGALGAPAPLEEYPPQDYSGGGLPGTDLSTGAGGGNWWDQLIGGETYDPSLYAGYDPYGGYSDAGYPDPFGWEPYAQDVAGMLGDVPVVGAPFEAAKQNGLALPALIGAVVLVVLAVAFLRSKMGKAMIGGVTKKVSGAANGAKKAVVG